MAPSTAQRGTTSTIVRTASHVDHTEHDVSVVATEQGLADLRGLARAARASDHRELCFPGLQTGVGYYLNRAERLSYGRHTPHF
jgi:succinyl-CoA:acetate CoA-transferase